MTISLPATKGPARTSPPLVGRTSAWPWRPFLRDGARRRNRPAEFPSPSRRGAGGSILPTTLVFAGLLSVTVLGMLELSSYRARMEYARWSYNAAYYHAENALGWATQLIADARDSGSPAPFLGNYSVSERSIEVAYMRDPRVGKDTDLRDAWVTIQAHPNRRSDHYLVTSSAKVGTRVRTLQATVWKDPPSPVFNYAYFLNNWAWWSGRISSAGDSRANWDFDLRADPRLEGGVVAVGNIESGGVNVDPLGPNLPFSGLAASNPPGYVHYGTPRLPMPNLRDLAFYEARASAASGKLWAGTRLVVDAVHRNSRQPGLFLVGTPSDPIKISGPVVIPGDVVIKGTITGIGTLYVGGNLYVAGNLTYLNGPSFDPPPALLPQPERDEWVRDAVSARRDLVAFVVRESVVGGAVNTVEWQARCFDAPYYGLGAMGDESMLGADGVAGTPDDGIAFRDTNGDGEADTAWYDADGDGKVNESYSWESQLSMNYGRVTAIDGYPTVASQVADFDDIASSLISRIDGVFFSNHAIVMRLWKRNATFNGAVTCRDDVIVYTGSLRFVYDPRVHGRYAADPARHIDLGLPCASHARVSLVEELPATEGFHTATVQP